jgi:salicylate hydroxylase
MFGAEPWAIHRVDLHNELLRLATSPDETGTVIKLHLSSEVVRGSTYGSIDLKDGSVRHADLVVAADGLKSVLRKLVTQDAKPPAHTGLSAFRLLVDTNKLDSNTGTASLVETFRKNANLLADPTEMEKERHMMWYGCRE